MATWQDGPEYAPLVPPSGFEPAGQPSPDLADGAHDLGADPSQRRSAPAPLSQPTFAAPESAVPLEALGSGGPEQRDPCEPFAVLTRTATSGSAWPAAHTASSGPLTSPPAYAPAPELGPLPAPQPPSVPTPAAYGMPFPHAPGAPYAPIPPALPEQVGDGADLEARERSARWLLLPAALYLVGTWTGPLVTLAMVVATILLITRRGVRPSAQLVSRYVLVIVTSVTVLSILVGDGLSASTALSRGVGLVYAFLCAMWFVRERSEIDAERQRRDRGASPWPPPPDHHSWPGPGPRPPQDRG